MHFSNKFICRSHEMCTYKKNVNAPYFRKSFTVDGAVSTAELTICGLGFYELYVNGKNITKGPLAPYISNPDDFTYYDTYDVAEYLNEGENVIGVLLGNGLYNAFGTHDIWLFDTAPWRGAPRFAMYFCADTKNGRVEFEADESFKSYPSPITFDEYRIGCHYDARLEQDGWCNVGYDDSNWDNAVRAEQPRGEAVLCGAEPIAVQRELKSVSIKKCGSGYVYDFGENCAGVCRMEIEGRSGQKIVLSHGEVLDENGDVYLQNVIFQGKEHTDIYMKYEHRDFYTCKGGEKEIFVPKFTYHGFRYVMVEGIEEEQAAESLLTYLVMNSDVKERGNFECSDEIINKLQRCTRNSDLANLYYFPTDCPQREKNGWTGDAAQSAEHMMLNLTVENTLEEWMKNIRKAQSLDGRIPGIVPTSGWGFAWGNGPAWDQVIVNIPYAVYKYTGNERIFYDNADMIFRYLNYITTQLDDRGLIKIGLGDWVQPEYMIKNAFNDLGTGLSDHKYSSPVEYTDTVTIMSVCQKAAFIFEKTGRMLQKEFALSLHDKLRASVRKHLIDTETVLAIGNCQTSQTLAIEFDVFNEDEKPQAIENLVEIIHEDGDRMNVGMIGARYLFRVLADNGYADLAHKLIVCDEPSCYGYWIKNGATALWEDFPKNPLVDSKNHHFFGDISAWFISYLAGIKPNPNCENIDEVEISPCFVEALDYAKAHFDAPKGRVSSEWRRKGEGVVLTVVVPEAMSGTVKAPNGYAFENGKSVADIASGEYKLVRK